MEFCILCNEKSVEIKKRKLCLKCYQKEWKKGKIPSKKIYRKWLVCKFCGRRFEKSHSLDIRKFCSSDCWHNSYHNKFPQNCKQCGKIFPMTKFWKNKGTKKFCSRECVGKWRSVNMKGVKSANWRSEKRYCLNPECKKEFWKSPSSKRKFCSFECSKIWGNKLNYRGKKPLTKQFAYYETYACQIRFCEEVKKIGRRLQVKCSYCGIWFYPTQSQVVRRIQAIKGQLGKGTEARFYCSDNCKEECGTYRQHLYPKGFKNGSSREVQPELRQIVFERDNWVCQICNLTESLHCHHITGVELNPIESADIDNCITLCKKCHKEVHKQKGCFPSDFRKQVCL
jgi:hypothetical protein